MSDYNRFYSVYDKIGDEYFPLFYAKNDNQAYRSFELSFKEDNNIPGNFDDYELLYVGKFSSSGKVEFISNPYIINGINEEKSNKED